MTTTQALERAELAMRVADRELRAAEFLGHAAEHEYDQARALLARYDDPLKSPTEAWNVTAPVTGVVLKIVQESETTVQPGTAILEIGDPRDLEIVVDVLSTNAVEVRPGAEVTIKHWGGPGSLRGQVRRVEPAAFAKVSTLGVEEQRVNVIVDIASPPLERTGLGDAFQLDTRIEVFAQDEATIMPAGALFRRGDAWKAFVVEKGRAIERTIKVARRSGRLALVVDGLQVGEQVIMYPSDRVSSGVRVQPR